MTRQAFMARLREGLRGMPPQTQAEILADYEAHFAEGETAGRSEAEVAGALGDPDRLARELRAEAGLKRWEETRSPSSAGSAIFAVLGLGALDLIFLLPILMGVAGAIIGVAAAVIGTFVAGAVLFAAGPFVGVIPGGAGAALLGGLGLMAAAASGGAVLAMVCIGLMNLLVWYGRLHYRLLKPALEPEAQGRLA